VTRRTLLGSLLGVAAARGQEQPLDRFGGWRGVRFEASGYFRLEKKERWWLVTPEGNAFLSFGLNHAEPGLLRQSYNREHWLKTFGGEAGVLRGFRAHVEADLKAFGFNSLGCHNATSRYWQPSIIPYIETFKCVDIDHWKTPRDEDFRDVYASEFEAYCETRAVEARLRERAKDPFLIGYAFTDCPILTELDAAPRPAVVQGAPRAGVSTWPRVLRNLRGDAAGKQGYVRLMSQRYNGDIRSFNRVYEIELGSFDALQNAANWRPAADPANAQEARDNQAFLKEILDRYYSSMRSVVRRHDPNHLILGDKLNGNTDTPDFAVETAARHVDAVFYQWYSYYGEQKTRLDDWSRLTGKPLFNGDSAYSVPSEQMPRPLVPHSRTHEERAERTLEYARSVFARPDFIGWSYCGWMDSWKAMPGKEIRQHAGLQDPFGQRHAPMLHALSGFARELYRVARP